MVDAPDAHRSSPSRLAGHLLGVGLGGFVDGIVLHQIAQWHSMGSAVLPPVTMAAMSRNMTWDGLFHAATWCVVVAGVFRLVADARRGRRMPGPRALTGQLLTGWGLFNLVEGVVDHHLLGLHHVRDLPTHVPALDWWFLAVAGVGTLVAGRLLERAGLAGDR